MVNMSYCRFHNALIDLKDCLDALQNRDIANGEEKIKTKIMLEKICAFLIEEDLISLNIAINYRGIDELIAECE